MLHARDAERAMRSVVIYATDRFSACDIHWPLLEEHSDATAWIEARVSLTSQNSREKEAWFDVAVEANLFIDESRATDIYQGMRIAGTWAALFHQKDVEFLGLDNERLGWLRFGVASITELGRAAPDGRVSGTSGYLQWNIRAIAARVDSALGG